VNGGVRKAAPAPVIVVARVAGAEHVVLQPFAVIGQAAVQRELAVTQMDSFVPGRIRRLCLCHPSFHEGQDFLDRSQAQSAVAVRQERRADPFGGFRIESPMSLNPRRCRDDMIWMIWRRRSPWSLRNSLWPSGY